MAEKNRFYIILSLGILSAVGPFSIDMYLPAFPVMADNLNTTVPHIQLSLSSYFIGISLGQLIYGPLIDRFGRLIPLFTGLFIYLLTCIACAFANTADTLIVMRFFQALGSCAGMVISRAMVRDIFPVSENARIFSLLMLVIGVSPILAPTLGGYMSSGLGWRSIFIFLILLAVFTIYMCYKYLPESKPADKTMSLKPKAVLEDFWFAFSEPRFIYYALAGGIASAAMFAYIAGSTFVFIELFGFTEKQYGWLFALNAIGLISASQLNSKLLKKYPIGMIIKNSSRVQLTTVLLLAILSAAQLLNVYSTLILIWIFMSALGFFSPNTSALSMAPFDKKAGIASALLGCFQMLFSALASFAVSFLHDGTAFPMIGVMAFCIICSFSLVYIGQRQAKKYHA
ncbi:multidrug effflux MFS transporter [Pedobacter aquae]|uniref:Multidrug effflux MFS transporter n=1 Tax=Pedobacter aquae TaxID=2605747 RepID=A0A5C0VBX4_9SPHI|nr:multidrug effflux MFS transporter [Pedobacter aquae]QEK50255.1 multidrug effflux MFS transporter [Pedobacter aquae]